MLNCLRNFFWKTGGLVAALLAGLLAAAPARAEHTRYWRQTTYEEFEKGTAKGVALRSDGKLELASRFASFSDPNTAYLWSLRVDSKGNLYAAGGSNAKVLRFDTKGNAATVFESAEMAAQALAIDAHDNLYIGTSPDGKVYQVTLSGEKKVFFEPKTKYIWDLAVDAQGTVYVATGDKGEIFAVRPDGKGQVFYNSEETHIRALALDPQGNLLAGTEPNGLILRIPKPATTREKGALAAGDQREPRAFVLYETSKKEVTALLVDHAGNTYAAAIGEKARPPYPVIPQVPSIQPPVVAGITAAQATAAAGAAQIGQQPTVFVPFPPAVGSAVYRLAPDGAPEELWSSREDLVYALGLSPTGNLLLGTGNRGAVIQLEGNHLFSSLAKTASSQVTHIAQGPSGKIYLCTANPGKVFTLGPDLEPEGTFESQTFDARIFSQWGRLEWWGENDSPGGALKTGAAAPIALYVRSGNTSNPEKNWSPWAGPYTDAQGQKVDCPSARFVQWKVVFRSPRTSGGITPNLSWVSLSYLPKNIAPVIDAIVVQNPGIRIQTPTGPPPGTTPPPPVQLRLPPRPPGTTGSGVFAPQQTSTENPPPRFEAPPQGFAQKGSQSVVWSAHDDNDDTLVFRIYYRGEGEKNWKLLKDRLEHKFYSWDASTMPDGAYYLRIVVSDAPSNPPEEALAAERESDRFEVDNTPPVVENLSAAAASPDVRVRFTARDSYSAIARAEYSLDAGDWTLVFPAGRLTDAQQENYEILLRDLAPGEHTVAVRVFDQFENTASAKLTFTVPPKKR